MFFDVNSEDIKTNIENISIDGIKITILSPEMTIINFLMQMILDGNINHYGIIDIDIVLSISKINKDELTRLIDSYGLKKYISIFHPNIYKTAYGEEHTHTLYDKAMKLVLNKFFHVQPGNFGTLHKFKKLLLWSLIIENSSLSKLYRKSKGC